MPAFVIKKSTIRCSFYYIRLSVIKTFSADEEKCNRSGNKNYEKNDDDPCPDRNAGFVVIGFFDFTADNFDLFGFGRFRLGGSYFRFGGNFGLGRFGNFRFGRFGNFGFGRFGNRRFRSGRSAGGRSFGNGRNGFFNFFGYGNIKSCGLFLFAFAIAYSNGFCSDFIKFGNVGGKTGGDVFCASVTFMKANGHAGGIKGLAFSIGKFGRLLINFDSDDIVGVCVFEGYAEVAFEFFKVSVLVSGCAKENINVLCFVGSENSGFYPNKIGNIDFAGIIKIVIGVEVINNSGNLHSVKVNGIAEIIFGFVGPFVNVDGFNIIEGSFFANGNGVIDFGNKGSVFFFIVYGKVIGAGFGGFAFKGNFKNIIAESVFIRPCTGNFKSLGNIAAFGKSFCTKNGSDNGFKFLAYICTFDFFGCCKSLNRKHQDNHKSSKKRTKDSFIHLISSLIIKGVILYSTILRQITKYCKGFLPIIVP